MTVHHRVWIGCLLAIASHVHGQVPVIPKVRPTIKVHREANRMVKQLELPGQRSAAVTRLLALGAAAVPELARALTDPRAEIAVTAMGILRMLGPHAAPALPRLMKIASGRDERMAIAAKWAMAGIRPLGITLVADINKQRLVEFDQKGKVILEIGKLSSIWDAERLPNGNYLVCRGGTNRILELDRKGTVVWKYDKARFPMDADRLPSGNTLICDTKRKRVIEIDPAGEIVWKYTKLEGPYDADRLPSGNTLIADYGAGKAIEVDPRGRIVWKVTGVSQVLSVDRTPSGNTLLSLWSKNTVREVDAAGQTVLEIKLPKNHRNPSSVQRLQNGHTLVGARGAAIEYDAKGVEVWRVAIGGGGSVIRY
jgi:hypothetical protein